MRAVDGANQALVVTALRDSATRMLVMQGEAEAERFATAAAALSEFADASSYVLHVLAQTISETMQHLYDRDEAVEELFYIDRERASLADERQWLAGLDIEYNNERDSVLSGQRAEAQDALDRANRYLEAAGEALAGLHHQYHELGDTAALAIAGTYDAYVSATGLSRTPITFVRELPTRARETWDAGSQAIAEGVDGEFESVRAALRNLMEFVSLEELKGFIDLVKRNGISEGRRLWAYSFLVRGGMHSLAQVASTISLVIAPLEKGPVAGTLSSMLKVAQNGQKKISEVERVDDTPAAPGLPAPIPPPVPVPPKPDLGFLFEQFGGLKDYLPRASNSSWRPPTFADIPHAAHH